ncbi:MAG TPA: hypothetical protein VF355_08610 [Anaerolineaceae bacterium]
MDFKHGLIHARVFDRLLVQPLGVVHQLTVDVSLYCLADFLDVGQNWLDTTRGQCIVGTHAHAARQQDLAISDRVHHNAVAVLGSWIEPMTFAGLMIVMFLFGELAVIGFGTRFLCNDLAILHCEYLIILGAAKMGGYGFEIVGDDSNFHISPHLFNMCMLTILPVRQVSYSWK